MKRALKIFAVVFLALTASGLILAQATSRSEHGSLGTRIALE